MLARLTLAAILAATLAACGGGADPAPVANVPAGVTDEPAAPVDTDEPEPANEPEPTAAPEPDCLEVSAGVRDGLAADIAPGETGKVEEAAAITIDPPTSDSGEQWYAFAFRLGGGDAAGAIPVWVTTSDPAAEGFGGATFAANPAAEMLAPYPFPDAIRDWALGAGGEQVRRAEACAAP